MEPVNLRILMFDVNVLYSWNFYKLFIELLNRHWDFFKTYGCKKQLTVADIKKIKATTSTIIAKELDQIELPDGQDLIKMVRHPDFKACIHAQEKNKDLFALFSPLFSEFMVYINQLHANLASAIFLQANKWLCLHFMDEIRESKANHIAIMLGNRTSAFHDHVSIHSLLLDLLYLQKCFQFFLPDRKIVVCSSTLVDIYSGFSKRFRSHANLSQDFENSMYDENKLILLSAIAPQVITYVLNVFNKPGVAQASIDFCDNWFYLQNALEVLTSLNSNRLSKNITLNLYHYQGPVVPAHFASITGRQEVKSLSVGMEGLFSRSKKITSPVANHDDQTAFQRFNAS